MRASRVHELAVVARQGLWRPGNDRVCCNRGDRVARTRNYTENGCLEFSERQSWRWNMLRFVVKLPFFDY